ncbi:hypothetical protein EVAR_65728_1 [Eumeta japonica]|uniref:Uncharacterized protein n=1 Tax=Eumeta variegata TaxID=151549 RepID=A0A4C2A9S8_EUMVA|nr:hypothetical protein EVAR_65728_1 [Eumeta japonica]
MGLPRVDGQTLSDSGRLRGAGRYRAIPTARTRGCARINARTDRADSQSIRRARLVRLLFISFPSSQSDVATHARSRIAGVHSESLITYQGTSAFMVSVRIYCILRGQVSGPGSFDSWKVPVVTFRGTLGPNAISLLPNIVMHCIRK